MKHLYLLFLDEEKLAALTPEDARALDNESLAYDEELRAGGDSDRQRAGRSWN